MGLGAFIFCLILVFALKKRRRLDKKDGKGDIE